MRALAIAVGLSLALHAGAAVWFLEGYTRGAEGEAPAQQAPSLTLASAASLARLVETWETTPEPATRAIQPMQPEVPDAIPDVSHVEPGPRAALVLQGPTPTRADELPRRPTVPIDPPPVEVHDSLRYLPVPAREGAVPEIALPSPVALPRLGTGPAAPAPETPVPTPPDHPGPALFATAAPVARPVPAANPRTATTAPAAAMASPAALAPAPAVEPPGARDAWADAIRGSIARHHRVPSAAVRRGLSGRVVLRITVTPDGALVALSLRASSGQGLLDEAAIATLRRAGRLPRAPDGVAGPITFDVPLTFRTG